jgi:hypothetical protein
LPERSSLVSFDPLFIQEDSHKLKWPQIAAVSGQKALDFRAPLPYAGMIRIRFKGSSRRCGTLSGSLP